MALGSQGTYAPLALSLSPVTVPCSRPRSLFRPPSFSPLPFSLQSAILSTLGKLISVGGAALRPFQPQLQASFVKALQDPVRAVRVRGAVCLGLLMPLSLRVDPLVTELLTALTSSDTPSSLRESLCAALTFVFWRGGDKVTAPVRARALEVLLPLACVEDGCGVEDEGEWRAAGSAVGAALRKADPSLLAPHMGGRVEVTAGDMAEALEDPGAASVRVDSQLDGKLSTVLSLLRYAPATLAADVPALLTPAVSSIAQGAQHPHYAIRALAARCAGFAIGAACAGAAGDASSAPAAGAAPAAPAPPPSPPTRLPLPPAPEDYTPEVTAAYRKAAVPTLLPVLQKLLADGSADVRRAAITASGRVALLGWHGAVGAGSAGQSGNSRAIGTALLTPVLDSLSKDSGNYVLRAVAERALVHWTTAARDRKAVTLSSPPGPVLGLLEAEQARFLTDLWRKTLQDAGNSLAAAGGYSGIPVQDPFHATAPAPVHVQAVGITASGEDEQEWDEDEDGTLKVIG